MTALMSSPIPRITEPRPTQGAAPSHSPPDVRYVPNKGLAQLLGYFSIGLGLAEVLAPRTMSQLTGVRSEGLLQAYGAREIACGLGILTCSRPTEWLWARVAGDVMDLATLAGPMTDADPDRRQKATAAAAAVLGVTALDVFCAATMTAASALADD